MGILLFLETGGNGGSVGVAFCFSLKPQQNAKQNHLTGWGIGVGMRAEAQLPAMLPLEPGDWRRMVGLGPYTARQRRTPAVLTLR